MSTARYTRQEKVIAAADAGRLRGRWEYGRLLVMDETMITPAGNLRNGKVAELIAAALKAGRKISEREIRYRLECAKAYPCESQIRHAGAEYDGWTDLRNAGFPAFDADEGDKPYDPRGAAERARDAARELARHGKGGDGQLSLFDYFPDDKFDELSTLADLTKYAEEMADLTERYARKDRERAEYLCRLINAVNGDMSKTAGEAQAALDAIEGDDSTEDGSE